MKRLRSLRRSDIFGALLSLVGVLVALAGAQALIGALNVFQGEEVLLFVGGLALIVFGVMIVFRINLRAVKTGFAGLVTGYFAATLAAFEVATDPCDIGATLARCAGHVPGGHPWAVYEGPLILAALLFFVLALEPYASASDEA